ncbi:MAG: zf-HC2 domain-containing protein [Paraburkholderia sp.]|nr:MAG: zf-HC2 domain-containing protein [Paraburkholderia sp.]
MLTCKETTKLVSREADEELTLKETLDIRLHVLMCSACRNFRSNVQFLRRICKVAAASDNPTDGVPDDAS